ncbi:hypothetical protein DL96DRAFT_238211 [Flagelloscypha sp. PMI_526]|nr:hypothetical protein DL96DRAFT_238211 [Flagelloscypha sp. PMI_526]
MVRSKSIAELFLALPLDLARYIVEFAAQQALHTAVSFVLVSKVIQSWTDPFLFHTIARAPFPLQKFITLLSSRNFASPRIIQAREYIRHVYTTSYISRRYLFDLFYRCPNISCLQIATGISTLRDVARTTPRSLRRLYLTDSTWGEQNFSTPFFRNITHLIVFHSPSTMLSGHAESLQKLLTQLHTLYNLTHLCTNILIGYVSQVNELIPKGNLRGLEASSRKLRIFLLSVERWSPESDDDWHMVTTWDMDPRFVVGVLLERCIDLDEMTRWRMQVALPEFIFPENG